MFVCHLPPLCFCQFKFLTDTLPVLLVFAVHPDYQRQGIGSLLLQWGLEKADELAANIWLTSTPQAVSMYEKNGWTVMERNEIDLGKHGGEGVYTRAWMLRKPKNTSV
jgi:GNAT superfamily N-acetyltransferase